jgi:hypothetical protein
MFASGALVKGVLQPCHEERQEEQQHDEAADQLEGTG